MATLMKPDDWTKALVLGITVSGLLSLVSITGMQTGMSPMPEPLGLVFTKTIFSAEKLPLVVGLLFHTAWVTLWTVVFVVLARDNPTLVKALSLGLVLWAVVLVVFFPIVGWGFFGLGQSAALIVGSLVPHVLFALFLWGGCRVLFPTARA